MARRKQTYDHDRLYAITYRDGGSTFAVNVAAVNLEGAISIFRVAVGSHIINKIERTDTTTYYGVNR